MIRALIAWAVDNRLVVSLLTIALVAFGGYCFVNINVEAYPDPAPAIVEIIAQYPGASAEEVERQVTIPLEVALSGMPELKYTRSKSLFGLSHVRNQFSYAMDYNRARTEVLNRLALLDLPPKVSPQISPMSPIGELYRYTVESEVDERGRPYYELHDLKSLQDWTLEREFRRIPRIASVVSFGGQEKRYEIQLDPERLRQYDITLQQVEDAVSASNANAGGDYLRQPHTVKAVRGLGLLGGGQDPFVKVQSLRDAADARRWLRAEESRRIREIRDIVLAATNNVPVHLSEVVDGGRDAAQPGARGVVVGHPTRMGQVSVARPEVDEQGAPRLDEQGRRVWREIDDTVEGVVLLRKNEQSLPALNDVKAKFADLNGNPGRLPPGIKLQTFYDRTRLIDRITETVHENLFLGMFLVSVVLLVFLNHLRSALIVAINIPLALLFAFTMLHLRGQSANLLSLGAVDFGIIVDSSVIMVESIYRKLSSGEDPQVPLPRRILMAAGGVERSLFYSTLIMVFALLPLFTMNGPEGQIFGPMAETYAFSLGGALLLALTVSPMLCRLLMGRVRPSRDNWFVRSIKFAYLRQLEWMLPHRWLTLAGFLLILAITGLALPFLGREFMPVLEEGNVYIRGTFPVNVSLDEAADKTRIARHVLQEFTEAAAVLSQVGRPDDGTDPTGFYNSEIFVALRPQEEWPKSLPRSGWRAWLFGGQRHRTKDELVDAMNRQLDEAVFGVDWNFSQAIRDNVMETLSGVKGENSIKIIGPDLNELERKAEAVARELNQVSGITNVGIFSIMGQTNLELAIDREQCSVWNVSVADVQDVLQTAVGGKAFSKMVEGERTFDITLRYPERLRATESQILDIPVEVVKNRVVSPESAATTSGISPLGTSQSLPTMAGTKFTSISMGVPRRRLRELVTAVDDQGEPDQSGSFTKTGASTIYREQGQRLIALKFSVRGRDLASAVADAQGRTRSLIDAPYRAEWSGEFQQMEEAVRRLAIAVTLALIVILVLLYLALRSALDVLVVFANVLVICIGGIWALLLTGLNFNISAGVGFISILGVGMMNGLIVLATINHRRAQGIPLQDAILGGMERCVRPLTMIPLTAIFGMLPAALATKIGSETQRPLAIVIVGGMTMTLLLLNLLPVLYAIYGHREPPHLTVPSVDH
jgi:cobalt-zinc-cadmium resistance protein CzcA